MAVLTKPINGYRYAEFAIKDASELGLLPTCTKYGKENLQTISPVCGGSAAYTTDGVLDIYILDEESDTWKLS